MEISRSERYNREFSLLFIDVDFFKHYNDENGHLAGDELLKDLARLVNDFLRKSDFLARYGGEEFTVILPGTSKISGIKVAGSIKKIVENHSFYASENQPEGKVTVSIGLASYPDDAQTGDVLIDKADRALYKAKQTGRHRVCVYGAEDRS